MKTSEYFAKRAEQLADKGFVAAEELIKRQLAFYAGAIEEMQRYIESFYGKYLKDSISLSEARKTLTKDELKAFRDQLKTFKNNASGKTDSSWIKFLDVISSRLRLSRLDVLQVQMQQQVEILTGAQQVATTEHLTDQYQETYNGSVYNLQVGAEVGAAFAQLDTKAITKALSQNWDESNYSARIWMNRNKLVRELQTAIPNAIARGESIQKTTSILKKRMEVSRSNAERLIRTETAHIIQEATFDGYGAAGFVQKYKILATLDKRTSEICRSMDGKVFLLSEKQVGVTAPPFHPNCRSTTVVDFGEDVTTERIGRNLEGKNVSLPGNITYEQWAKQFGVKTKAKFSVAPVDDRGIKGGDR